MNSTKGTMLRFANISFSFRGRTWYAGVDAMWAIYLNQIKTISAITRIIFRGKKIKYKISKLQVFTFIWRKERLMISMNFSNFNLLLFKSNKSVFNMFASDELEPERNVGNDAAIIWQEIMFFQIKVTSPLQFLELSNNYGFLLNL